jgi:hypothetical protein
MWGHELAAISDCRDNHRHLERCDLKVILAYTETPDIDIRVGGGRYAPVKELAARAHFTAGQFYRGRLFEAEGAHIALQDGSPDVLGYLCPYGVDRERKGCSERYFSILLIVKVRERRSGVDDRGLAAQDRR